MYIQTSLLEQLARDRHAARYRHNAHADEWEVPTRSAEAPGGAGPVTTTRHRAGWLLVGVGLRLALPGSHREAGRG